VKGWFKSTQEVACVCVLIFCSSRANGPSGNCLILNTYIHYVLLLMLKHILLLLTYGSSMLDLILNQQKEVLKRAQLGGLYCYVNLDAQTLLSQQQQQTQARSNKNMGVGQRRHVAQVLLFNTEIQFVKFYSAVTAAMISNVQIWRQWDTK